MKIWRDTRGIIALLLAGCIACHPAYALITLNDSHDHLWVTTSVTMSHDSNILASTNAPGDYIYSSTLAAEYQRRAGWIGVNAGVSVNAARFGVYKGENFNNPSYSLELTKQTGRTTGSLTLNATRSSQADAALNVRTISWNYGIGLTFKYPIIERFTLTGGLNYAGHRYEGGAAAGLDNLSTYAANADVIYILPHERDLIGGYRYRYVDTSAGSAYVDHALTAGLGGKIFFGLNGSVRAGYQIRDTVRVGQVEQGASTAPGSDSGRFSSWTANAAVTYPINRKLNLTGSLAKDFSTTATNVSVDSTTAELDATYSYNARWGASGNVGWGDSKFLGENGRVRISEVPLLFGAGRHDDYLTWGINFTYTRSEHLTISYGYTWFENWSNAPGADFIRASWTLTVSSRW